ncbi:uncharacterized protein DUF1674 [Mycoplana dimorpha]|uniref:Uncharacterized protein DUF1674 n=2 Tax=Mycoplana dimorpha TaxID=28320 RepID=A0A2T5BAR1_MYCDI|nr:uncharacterized protein DUF1674 [Mycoplana dimorpha]
MDKTLDKILQSDNDNAMGSGRVLPPAAVRALEEAAARRAAETQQPLPREIGGRGGLDPARFGDWEIKGRAIDF